MTDVALVTAQGLTVKLAGRQVLRDVSLSLSSGHLVALVGPNGAGKTTLLRALAGLVPSEGVIHVRGDALSSLSLRERARRFAYLPQGHLVHWPLPARDIVALGRYPHGATDPAVRQTVLRAQVRRHLRCRSLVVDGAFGSRGTRDSALAGFARSCRQAAVLSPQPPHRARRPGAGTVPALGTGHGNQQSSRPTNQWRSP